MSDTYIVICLDDTPAPADITQPQTMVLATRRVFGTHKEAEAYARTISYTRYPGVVAGDFAHLRLPQE